MVFMDWPLKLRKQLRLTVLYSLYSAYFTVHIPNNNAPNIINS